MLSVVIESYSNPIKFYTCIATPCGLPKVITRACSACGGEVTPFVTASANTDISFDTFLHSVHLAQFLNNKEGSINVGASILEQRALSFANPLG